MPFADLPGRESILHIFREREDAQRIGHVFPALSDALSYFGVLQIEFGRESLERERPIDRIEIFTLQIFDDGELELHAVVILAPADHDGHVLNARNFCCSQAALARNELVFDKYAFSGPFDLFARDRERLENSVLSY